MQLISFDHYTCKWTCSDSEKTLGRCVMGGVLYQPLFSATERSVPIHLLNSNLHYCIVYGGIVYGGFKWVGTLLLRSTKSLFGARSLNSLKLFKNNNLKTIFPKLKRSWKCVHRVHIYVWYIWHKFYQNILSLVIYRKDECGIKRSF